MEHQRYAIVHAVTTHGLANKGRIMELALLLHDGPRETDRWSGLVRPRCTLDPHVQRITGITPEMVGSGRSFGLVAARLQRMLSDRILVMHGAAYGLKVLDQAFARMGLPFAPTTLCTEKLARTYLPDSPRFDMFSLSDGDAGQGHFRALPIAEATRDLLFRFLQEQGEAAVHAHRSAPAHCTVRAQAA